jgi:PST family polysaccharide transporter
MLKRSAFFNSLWTVVGNGGQLAVSLGTFLYLARILSPRDFGVMALAAAFIDLLTLFGRFGQVEALLQKGADDQKTLSTAFWILTTIGVAILALVGGTAYPFAAVSKTPVIALVLLMLAAVPLIQNLGQVNEAILRRDFRYKGIAVRNVVATLLGAVAAVILASLGYGVFALAAQKLVYTVTYTAAVWIAQPWKPSRVFERAECPRLLRTGLDVTISNTLQIANGRIVDFNVAFFLGVVTLGVSRVAWRLYEFALQLVVTPITSVAISSLSRLSETPVALRNAYLRYVELIFLSTAPLFVGISLLSKDVVLLMAGAKWAESASVLSLLSLSALGGCLGLIFGPVMIVQGRTQAIRSQALWQTAFTIVVIGVAAQFSLLAVVVAHVARIYLFAVINLVIMNRSLGVEARPFLARITPPLAATAIMAAACFACGRVSADWPLLARIAAVAGVGAIVYFGALFAGDRLGVWRGFVADMAALARELLQRRRTTAPVAASPNG